MDQGRCPHCNARFSWHESAEDPTAVVDNNACGICTKCYLWWKYQDGQYLKYIPNLEEQEQAVKWFDKQ